MQTNHTLELFPFYSVTNKLARTGVEVKVKVIYSIPILDRPLGLYKVEAPRVSRHEKHDVNCAARGAGSVVVADFLKTRVALNPRVVHRS